MLLFSLSLFLSARMDTPKQRSRYKEPGLSINASGRKGGREAGCFSKWIRGIYGRKVLNPRFCKSPHFAENRRGRVEDEVCLRPWAARPQPRWSGETLGFSPRTCEKLGRRGLLFGSSDPNLPPLLQLQRSPSCVAWKDENCRVGAHLANSVNYVSR